MPTGVYQRVSREFGKTKCPFGRLQTQSLATIPADRMAFYAKRVGPKLQALIQQGIEDYKTGDISEEIVLTREIVSNSLGLYQILLDTEGLDPQAKLHALHHAGQQFIHGADQVTKLHERQAKINALIGGQLMPDAVQKVTEQISKFVYRCFDDRPEQVAEFDRMMSEELELPVLANSMNIGTRITPDMEAYAMDATIPMCTEESITEN
jgi:hypothetical protein